MKAGLAIVAALLASRAPAHADPCPSLSSLRRAARDHAGLDTLPTWRGRARTAALLPMVTLIAINLGYVVAGAITAEIVFTWPGLGTLTVQALDARDYPLLQAIFLIVAVSVVLANLAADIIYGYLDPRVRT